MAMSLAVFSAKGSCLLSLSLSPSTSHRKRTQWSKDVVKKRKRFSVCCARSSEEEDDKEESNGFQDSLEGLESTVEKMLLDSPAVKSAIARISAATERYEESVRKKAELEAKAQLTPKQKEEIEELMSHQVMAEAQVEAAKKRLKAAELKMLAVTDEELLLNEMARRNADRLESVKAFTASSLSGVAALFPILLVEAGNIERDVLHLMATAFSSGLYGITYRYAIGDGKNVQLKLGVVSAFWIVSSLSSAQSVWNAVSEPLSYFDIHLLNRIGLQSVQMLIIFLASTLALEFSFRKGFIRHATSPANKIPLHFLVTVFSTTSEFQSRQTDVMLYMMGKS